MINTVLPGALRANARGLYACEAAVGFALGGSPGSFVGFCASAGKA